MSFFHVTISVLHKSQDKDRQLLFVAYSNNNVAKKYQDALQEQGLPEATCNKVHVLQIKNLQICYIYHSLSAFIPENTSAGKLKTVLNESHSHARGWIHLEPLHWPFTPGLCQAPAASLGKQALNLVQAQLLVKLGHAIEAAVT